MTVIAPPTSSRASLAGPREAGEEDDAEGEDRDSDRDVDEEDPVPGQEIREDPAEEHADGASAGRDEAERRPSPSRGLPASVKRVMMAEAVVSVPDDVLVDI